MEGSDAAVVARVRAGDREAFRTLVERYSHRVFRLAYRMSGSETDAEDVVQETFLRVYRQLHRFEERAQFGTWLYRIAANCSLDLVRARRRHTDKRVHDDPETGSPLDMVAADGPTADRLVFSSQVGERIEAALARLSPRERTAFVLRHFEGHSTEEIGRALGLRPSAAKNTVFRAVQKLRAALEPVVSTTR